MTRRQLLSTALAPLLPVPAPMFGPIVMPKIIPISTWVEKGPQGSIGIQGPLGPDDSNLRGPEGPEDLPGPTEAELWAAVREYRERLDEWHLHSPINWP